MSRARSPRQLFLLRILAAGLATVLGTGPLMAAELKLELRLIWCTNEKLPHDKHKEVEPATVEKFRKVPFKWKYYYEINRVTGTVPSRGTKPFKMSDKCTIEITEMEGPKVEAKLIGEGRPVVKATKNLAPGEWTTIGGDDKDGAGWFVLITELGEK
jgi:hypothetical protein